MSVTELLSGPTLRDTDNIPLLVDDDFGDVERLLAVLRQPDPEPLRVKVRAVGSTERLHGIGRTLLFCADGYSATCTTCGDLDTYGAQYASVVVDYIAKSHLRDEHRTAVAS